MFRRTKTIILILITLTLVILAAFNPVNTSQGTEYKNMAYEIGYKQVDRVEVLETFFEKYNSPLKSSAETFVRVADEFQIDYALLPSIACQESTCGRFLIEGSFNPFGWGIYGDQYIAFNSYNHAIEEVGKGLYENYFSKGYDTLDEIAPIYTPRSNGSWFRGVSWFEAQIGNIVIAI